MPTKPISTWFFAFVVVQKANQFLLIRERKYNQAWYFPGGRLEAGETFLAGAKRETLEESGVPVNLEGIIRIEHIPLSEGTHFRVFFLASPADDSPAKTEPDEESLGADWFTLEEIAQLPLRREEVQEICQYVAEGGEIYPLNLIHE